MIQVLGLTVSGIVLVWFGYAMFFGPASPIYTIQRNKPFRGRPGDPQVCPVCSIKMVKGDLVKSVAFPNVYSEHKDRLMYIRGCVSCLHHDLPRSCPICGAELSVKDYLVSRMFERPNRNNHIHVFGCNHCKRVGTIARVSRY
jgi:hypothetical protein